MNTWSAKLNMVYYVFSSFSQVSRRPLVYEVDQGIESTRVGSIPSIVDLLQLFPVDSPRHALQQPTSLADTSSKPCHVPCSTRKSSCL